MSNKDKPFSEESIKDLKKRISESPTKTISLIATMNRDEIVEQLKDEKFILNQKHSNNCGIDTLDRCTCSGEIHVSLDYYPTCVIKNVLKN